MNNVERSPKAFNARLIQRFVLNHASYVTLNELHPRQYFALKIELYDLLTQLHAKRITAATTWLERRGVLESVPLRLLRPNTSEWFISLREWNPKQAAMVDAAIRTAGSLNVCSVCADDPAHYYASKTMPAAGLGTLRLCDACFHMRSAGEPMKPF